MNLTTCPWELSGHRRPALQPELWPHHLCPNSEGALLYTSFVHLPHWLDLLLPWEEDDKTDCSFRSESKTFALRDKDIPKHLRCPTSQATEATPGLGVGCTQCNSTDSESGSVAPLQALGSTGLGEPSKKLSSLKGAQ